MKFALIMISLCTLSGLSLAMERTSSQDTLLGNDIESKVSQDEQFETLDAFEIQRNLSQDKLSDTAFEIQRKLSQDEFSDASDSSIKWTRKPSQSQLIESSNPDAAYVTLSNESYSHEAQLILAQAQEYRQHGAKALLFRNILVHGPIGSGKTTFIKQIAALMGQKISKVNCDTLMTRVVNQDRAKTIMQYIPGICLMAQLANAIWYAEANVVHVKKLPEMLRLLNGDFGLNLRDALKSINKGFKKSSQKIVFIEWGFDHEIDDAYARESRDMIQKTPHCISVQMNLLSWSDSEKIREFYLQKLKVTDYMPSALHSFPDNLPALLVYNVKKLKLEQDMKARSITKLPVQNNDN